MYFKQIHPSGRLLLLLVLVKPIIDLLYMFDFRLAGIRFAPTTITGISILLYYAIANMRNRKNIKVKYAGLFLSFILINVFSVVLSIAGEGLNMTLIMDVMIRIADSYLIFVAAYIAAVHYNGDRYKEYINFFAFGLSVAIIINLIGIKLGYGGVKAGASSAHSALRNSGLYYDAGVMSIVALFTFIFGVYAFHVMAGKMILRKLYYLFILLCALYTIYLGLSRIIMIEVVLFAVIYLVYLKKTTGKIFYIGVAIGLASILASTNILDIDRLTVRFQGDIAALSNLDQEGSDALKKLGNNRVANWSSAIESNLSRHPIEVLFGNFSGGLAHSDYIDVLARNGIVGLIIYVTMLLLFLKLLRRNIKRNKGEAIHVFAFSLLLLYIIYAFPFRPLLYTTTAWYMWILIAFSIVADKKNQLEKRRQFVAGQKQMQ